MLTYNGTLQEGTHIEAKNLTGFILPTQPYYSIGWTPTSRKYLIEYATELCENAGAEPYDPDDMLVDLCMVNHETGIENFFGHGIGVKTDDGIYHIEFSSKQGFVPAKIFDGLKEGDTITLTFPGRVYDKDGGEFTVIVDAEINLAQLKTGHRSLGGFDDVIRAFKAIPAKDTYVEVG